jgi:hypothetical protein
VFTQVSEGKFQGTPHFAAPMPIKRPSRHSTPGLSAIRTELALRLMDPLWWPRVYLSRTFRLKNTVCSQWNETPHINHSIELFPSDASRWSHPETSLRRS